MTKYLTIISFYLLFTFFLFQFIFVKPVLADLVGQPPYLKINDKFALTYIVPLSSVPFNDFTLPQNMAPENYLLNQPLRFELNENFLHYSLTQKDFNQAKFTWNFGDGNTEEGKILSHTYSKIGSYILTLQITNTTDYVSPDASRPFGSVLINILPRLDYQLPQAVIKVNGKGVNDPLLDVLQFLLDKPLDLGASNSTAKSGYISSYFWDFGDGQKGSGSFVSHKYDPTASNIFPVLRIRDNNGFISDTFVEVDNSLYTDNNIGNITNTPSNIAKSNKQISNTIPKQTSDQNFFTSKLDQLTNSFLAFRTKNFSSLQKMVSEQLLTKQINFGLIMLILVFAAFAGSLHAFTPGHGKSLMAAFLIGKGSSKFLDVLIIALSITLAHTSVIFILGLSFLLINNFYPLNNILPAFENFSALLIAILALSLLYKGYKNWKHQKDHKSGHSHEHSHSHSHNLSHYRNDKWGLFLAGVSGGMVPCIDALSLLILSISLGQIVLGLIIVTFFSVGLAGAIILIGLMVVTTKNKFNLENRFGPLAQVWGPVVSGLFILVLAARLLIK